MPITWEICSMYQSTYLLRFTKIDAYLQSSETAIFTWGATHKDHFERIWLDKSVQVLIASNPDPK